MRATLRPRYTFAEYLQIERLSAEVRHQYVSGEVFAMAGGSVEHAALATAVVGLVFAHLRGGPCRPYGSDLQKRLYYQPLEQPLESLQEYALIAQDRRRVEVWHRDGKGEDAQWSHSVYEAGGTAPLSSIGYDLAVDALYDAAGVG